MILRIILETITFLLIFIIIFYNMIYKRDYNYISKFLVFDNYKWLMIEEELESCHACLNVMRLMKWYEVLMIRRNYRIVDDSSWLGIWSEIVNNCFFRIWCSCERWFLIWSLSPSRNRWISLFEYIKCSFSELHIWHLCSYEWTAFCKCHAHMCTLYSSNSNQDWIQIGSKLRVNMISKLQTSSRSMETLLLVL